MKKLFVLTVILLLFFGCAGDGESDEIDFFDQIDTDVDNLPVCVGGTLLPAGQSCTYNSGRDIFSINEDGTEACIHNVNSGKRICGYDNVSSNDGFFASNGDNETWQLDMVPR